MIKNPSSYAPLDRALRPVRKQLVAPLATIFRDTQRETERIPGDQHPGRLRQRRSDLLADLLMDADPKAYASFLPGRRGQAAKTLPLVPGRDRQEGDDTGERQGLGTVKDQLAERQARAAVALVRMGKAEEVWPLLGTVPTPGSGASSSTG